MFYIIIEGEENMDKIYCYHCFAQIEDPGNQLCPKCGNKYNIHYAQSSELPAGTFLNNKRYLVGKSIGSGGFGISYVGFDTKLKKKILIKETFYSGLFKRNTLDKDNTAPLNVTYGADISLDDIMKKTEKECISLSGAESLDNIVKVYDWFSENNTAYIITEYINGVTLYDRVIDQGRYTWEELKSKIIPLMNSLSALHKTEILHRDIKPQNIMIKQTTQNEERFILIDFGLARSTSKKTMASVYTAFSPGYSPMEQRAFLQKDGTYTDVYSLAATIYFALTGVEPDDEIGGTVNINFPLLNKMHSEYKVPVYVVNTLRLALETDYRSRTNDIDKFMSSLNNEKNDLKKSDKKQLKKTDKTNSINNTVIASQSDEKSRAKVNEKSKTKKAVSSVTASAKPQEKSDSIKAENATDDIDYFNITENPAAHFLKNTRLIAASVIALVAIASGVAIYSYVRSTNDNDAPDNTVSVVSSEASQTSEASISSQSSEISSSTLAEGSPTALKLPSFVGENIGIATDYFDEKNLAYTVEEIFSDSVDKGKIISQTPDGNADINSSTNISLKVSKGRDTEKITASSSSGKTNSSKSEDSKANTKENKSDSSAKKEAAASSQAPSNKVVVPKLVGQSSDAAMNTLTSLDLYYTGNYAFSDTVPSGQVISQSPAEGTEVDKHSRITFVISNGKQPEQQVQEQPEQQIIIYENNEPDNTTQQSSTSNGLVIPIYRHSDNTIYTSNNAHWTSDGASLPDGMDFSGTMYGLSHYYLTPETYTVPYGSALYKAVLQEPDFYKRTGRVTVPIYYDLMSDQYINIETRRIYSNYGMKTGKVRKESALNNGLQSGDIIELDEIFVMGTDAYTDYTSQGYQEDTY